MKVPKRFASCQQKSTGICGDRQRSEVVGVANPGQRGVTQALEMLELEMLERRGECRAGGGRVLRIHQGDHEDVQGIRALAQWGGSMHHRLFGGNGARKGLTNSVALGPGWVLFLASQSDPPPAEALPFALSQGVAQWLRSQPAVRVRATSPVVSDGNTVGIHLWYDAT